MKLSIFQVDAFTNSIFKGNPAAICPLDSWLPDETLANIAKENNLSETAYFIKEGNGFHLRWFTPEIEMDLCGHATLASAHVIYEHLDYQEPEIRFKTLSGELIVKKDGTRLQMDFPSRYPEPANIPDQLLTAFNIKPKEIRKARDFFLIYENEEDVRNLVADQSQLTGINLGTGGVICTAAGNDVDFVSRFFTPGAAVFEDPVTGSAHCSLIPYWAKILGKEKMIAHQVSNRLGELLCVNVGDRVLISGEAVTYLQGSISI